MGDISKELRKAGDRSLMVAQKDKKNYAEALSRELAQTFADKLRSRFRGILPNEDGKGQESRARTSKGFKKLDVNYSTLELGLGLGVSIKTINFPDGASRRYTKNYTRVDGELRAEASDYHERQPYSVLAALIFLPADAAFDAPSKISSFGASVQVFRPRAGRAGPKDSPMLFERVFVALYDTDASTFGEVGFFDVMEPPPRSGKPRVMLTLDQVCDAITDTYDARNSPEFVWADGIPAPHEPPDVEPEEDVA